MNHLGWKGTPEGTHFYQDNGKNVFLSHHLFNIKINLAFHIFLQFYHFLLHTLQWMIYSTEPPLRINGLHIIGQKYVTWGLLLYTKYILNWSSEQTMEDGHKNTQQTLWFGLDDIWYLWWISQGENSRN